MTTRRVRIEWLITPLESRLQMHSAAGTDGLTWVSVTLSSAAMRARSLSDKYFFCSNCFSSSKIWRPVNVVRAFFFLSLQVSAPGAAVAPSLLWAVGVDDADRWCWCCSASVDAGLCASSLSWASSLRAAAPAPDVAAQIQAFTRRILTTCSLRGYERIHYPSHLR